MCYAIKTFFPILIHYYVTELFDQEEITQPNVNATIKKQQKVMVDLERKLKEEREEKEKLAMEKQREVVEVRRQLDSVRMSAGRGGATPNPQVRREEVICNDIELLSSLSPAASACHTYPSTADPLTGRLQTRGMFCLMYSVAVCVSV